LRKIDSGYVGRIGDSEVIAVTSGMGTALARAEVGALPTDTLLLDPSVHADLLARGVVSLDMETAAVAEVCEVRGVPWSVVRAISDRASDGSVDAEIFGLSNQDGSANLPAVARYELRHPGAVPRLVRLARGSKLATERAADAAIRAIG
jgi:hypothetical protein